MRIVNFKGTKVHDYLTIDVDFNKDLSILTGVNGSGKTTAIILLQAILCPNFKDLISIPFDNLELTISHNDIETKILVTHLKGNLIMSIDKIEHPLEISKSKLEEFEFIGYKNKEGLEINDLLTKSLSPPQ